MSQEQPQKPEAVKYGDVFNVSGQLASQPIAPQDAASLQAAEHMVLGQTPKGGPAAAMQSAADLNKRRGAVGPNDVSDVIGDQGITVSKADIGGYEVISEAIGGQVVGQYGRPVVKTNQPGMALEGDAITIGEALEVTAMTAGDKPVDASDAAAIQAAEVRATGLGHVIPGGLAAQAQAAAAYNASSVNQDKDKAMLGDVLSDASIKLTCDKPVTKEVAEGVVFAEIRNKADMATSPGGVAASVAAAARLNQDK